MSEAQNQIEAVHFKAAPGGFVFRPPNPWLFGTPDHYLVNEAQKAEILTRLTTPRLAVRAAVVLFGLLAWALAVITLVRVFGSGGDNLSTGDLIVMTTLIIAGVVLAVPISIGWDLRRLRPILAGLPRTEQRITSCEMRAGLTASTSSRMLFINAGVSTALALLFLALSMTRPHSLSADFAAVMFLIVGIMNACAAVLQLVRALRAVRRRSAR